MSDFTAFTISGLVTLWLGAPLWVWVPFLLLAMGDVIATMGASD